MEDLRTQRTKKLINEAFTELVKINGFRKITVTEISTRALINRQTFYNYYQDKFDLADQLMNEILTDLEQILSKRLVNFNMGGSIKSFLQSSAMSDLLSKQDLFIALSKIHEPHLELEERMQRLSIETLHSIESDLTEFQLSLLSRIFTDLLGYELKKGKIISTNELESFRTLLKKLLK